ncbi:hypothetical protein C8J56DRAFT_1165430 [Mycena floridula]|nr:hypothetical protein C8J56DRAFT_1165430 [Mycena floridula]
MNLIPSNASCPAVRHMVRGVRNFPLSWNSYKKGSTIAILSAVLLTVAFAITLVIALPVMDASLSTTKRSVFDDCFNLGFEDGEAVGCNAAINGRRRYLFFIASYDWNAPEGRSLGKGRHGIPNNESDL